MHVPPSHSPRASFLVQEATHTTTRLDNGTPQSHHQKDPFIMLPRTLIFPRTSCLLRSYLLSYCAPQKGRRTSLKHTFQILQRYHADMTKHSRSNASEKVKLYFLTHRLHTAVTVIELNSHGPKDHTWCRYNTRPLSKALHKPEAGT